MMPPLAGRKLSFAWFCILCSPGTAAFAKHRRVAAILRNRNDLVATLRGAVVSLFPLRRFAAAKVQAEPPTELLHGTPATSIAYPTSRLICPLNGTLAAKKGWKNFRRQTKTES